MTTKFSINVLYVRIMALLGLPLIRSYYTKDLILESLSYCNSSWLAEALLYISTLFSFFYSMKLFSYGRRNIISGPYKLYNKVNLNLTLQIVLIILVNLISFKIVCYFASIEYIFFIPVNVANKVLLFRFLAFILIIWFLSDSFSILRTTGYSYCRRMINLSVVSKNIISLLVFYCLQTSHTIEVRADKIQLGGIKVVISKLNSLLLQIVSAINIFVYLSLISMIMIWVCS